MSSSTTNSTNSRKPKGSDVKFDDVVPLIQQSFGLTVLPKADRDALAAKAKDRQRGGPRSWAWCWSDVELKTLQDAFAETIKDVKSRSTDDYTYLLYGGYEPLTVKLTDHSEPESRYRLDQLLAHRGSGSDVRRRGRCRAVQRVL